MTNLLAEILRRKREDLTELLRVREEDSIRNNALRVRAMAEPHRLRKTLAAKNPDLHRKEISARICDRLKPVRFIRMPVPAPSPCSRRNISSADRLMICSKCALRRPCLSCERPF